MNNFKNKKIHYNIWYTKVEMQHKLFKTCYSIGPLNTYVDELLYVCTVKF